LPPRRFVVPAQCLARPLPFGLNSSFPRSVLPLPEFVIPAQAGIQRIALPPSKAMPPDWIPGVRGNDVARGRKDMAFRPIIPPRLEIRKFRLLSGPVAG
jgi:hypothetical protein